MKLLPMLILILSVSTFAAPAKSTSRKVIPKKTTPSTTPVVVENPDSSISDSSEEALALPSPSENSSNPTTTSTAATSAPAPSTPSPWRLVYSGEYYGPRLSNFNLSQTQAPNSSVSEYTGWNHALKAGLAVSSTVTLGAQIRANSPFAPGQTIAWKNHRIYAAWAHMIDTSDIDMIGILDAEFPTSAGAKANGLIMAFNLKNNWTIKTSLRNWNFSFLTLVRTTFFNNPNQKSDIYLGFFPAAQFDLFSDLSLLIEGNFDASHNYNNIYFDFNSADPDYLKAGFQYAINGHVQINPALQFYTSDFTVPTLYFALSAAL